MRTELKKINKIRTTFTGTFERFGTKSGYHGPETTVLIKGVKDSNGKIVADHLWFNYTKGFEDANLSEGDTVQFDARVKMYEKGYKGRREDVDSYIEDDYKLSFPTKIINLKNLADYKFNISRGIIGKEYK